MTLAPSQRRALLLLAPFILLLVVSRATPPAIAAYAGLSDRVAAKRLLLAEIESEIVALPALEDSARALNAGIAGLAPRLLAGNDGGAAHADLAGRVGLLALRHHARLLRAETLPDSAVAGRLRRVRARAILETDFRGVAELLEALERQALLLVPERLVITPQEPSAEPEIPERLAVELELSGWYFEGNSE